MAKRKQPKGQQEVPEQVFDSPFARLQSLRSSLPPGDPPASEPSEAQQHGVAGPAAAPDPQPQRLVLQREKKGRAGKTVTRLLGISSMKERERLMKQLKKELGCGAVLEGEDIVLLGDVGPSAKARLEACGFTRVIVGN